MNPDRVLTLLLADGGLGDRAAQGDREAAALLHDLLLEEFPEAYGHAVAVAEGKVRPRSWRWSDPGEQRVIALNLTRLRRHMAHRRRSYPTDREEDWLKGLLPDALGIFDISQVMQTYNRAPHQFVNVSGWQDAPIVYVARRGAPPPAPASGFGHERTAQDYQRRIRWERWTARRLRRSERAVDYQLAAGHLDAANAYERRLGELRAEKRIAERRRLSGLKGRRP